MPTVSLLPDDVVAIAGRGFQLGFVENGYVTPSVGDHSRFLQETGCHANCGAAGSQHLRQKLLS